MSKKLNEMRQQRNAVVVQARGILDKADAEKRDLSAEEQVNYDKAMGDQQRLADSISREERQVELERSIAAVAIGATGGDAGESRGEGTASKEYRAAFNKLVRFGRDGLSGDDVRALSASSDTEGGYLVMPQEMVSGLIKAVDDEVFIRRLATVYSIPTAASMGAPSLDADPADAEWTAELAIGSVDSTMAFGKRELNPRPLAKSIKVSNKLLRAAPGVEQIVLDRLAYKFGISMEKAFMTGSGANQPLGVFTASASGISTSRDVSTGNAATAFTVDGLIEAKYAVKGQYQTIGQWIFHRDAVKMLAKLKDGDGQYIWQPTKTEADPDRLLGRPVNMSEYAPNTFTTGLYVGIFGDFKQYWICDALNMQMQRLVELYAEANQTGFIGRMESDGMPVLGEAFARVKLG
jgi:HK97 family phage major capsid protein